MSLRRAVIAALCLLACETAQTAPPSTPNAANDKPRAIGICHAVYYKKRNTEPYEATVLDPESAAIMYFELYEGRLIRVYEHGILVNRVIDYLFRPPVGDITLVKKPQHGEVIYAKAGYDQTPFYQYIPNPGYRGDDTTVFRANVAGHLVRVVILHKVTTLWPESEGVTDAVCKKGTQWKISESTPNKALQPTARFASRG
jgi:hypothetical protein